MKKCVFAIVHFNYYKLQHENILNFIYSLFKVLYAA
jgi:hypothetical protein